MASLSPQKESTSRRQSTRNRRKKKYIYDSDDDPKIVSKSEDSDEVTEPNEPIKKPSEVLLEDDNVTGKDMFGFKKNQRKGGMIRKVNEILNTPRNSKKSEIKQNETIDSDSSDNESDNKRNTPEKAPKPLKLPPKTPHALRNKMKNEIAKLVIESDGDFSDSGSEFNPLSSSSSEDTEENEASDQSEDEIIHSKNSKSLNTKTRAASENYIMKSDDYFSWQANSKILTSNHTLQKLKTPKLSEDQLQELLTSCNLLESSEHTSLMQNLFQISCSYFNKWLYLLHEGFSVLLYGTGSKRKLLQTFQKEMLKKHPVVVINGYFPSLTIKDILDGILVDILEQPAVSNVYEAVDCIKDSLNQIPNRNIYLIIHNIDGPMLRNNKSQNILASLASISNMNLIASVDHINTPLIWDHSKLSQFNFTWWDVTTFLPYTDETSFESSMLVQRSGALALSSLTNVYQSLTKNSKGILKLIVKYQLEKKSEKHYLGMPFKVLYQQCRENFLVSSDLALRAQLTEFLDHKLMKTKRSPDGMELLLIPIHNNLLQQFLEQILE